MFLSYFQSIIILSLIAFLLVADAYFCLNISNISNKYFKMHLWILSLNKKVAKNEDKFRKELGYGSIRIAITIIILIVILFFVNFLKLNYKIIYLTIILQIIVVFYNQKKLSKIIKIKP